MVGCHSSSALLRAHRVGCGERPGLGHVRTWPRVLSLARMPLPEHTAGSVLVRMPRVLGTLAACAHSGRHYGEQARAVPVARTRAQELVFTGEALMRTLPALAPDDLTAVLPLQQGHPGI